MISDLMMTSKSTEQITNKIKKAHRGDQKVDLYLHNTALVCYFTSSLNVHELVGSALFYEGSF